MKGTCLHFLLLFSLNGGIGSGTLEAGDFAPVFMTGAFICETDERSIRTCHMIWMTRGAVTHASHPGAVCLVSSCF